MVVSWFSTGVSSFIATYLMRDEVDEIIYTHINDQHQDSLRYLHDCEEVLQKKITILKSDYFNCVSDVIKATGYFNISGRGAPCTNMLKMKVRKKWEHEHNGEHTYIWGFDINESERALRTVEAMPKYKHKFPLLEHGISKQTAHALLQQLKIERPVMYRLGYPNNNCIGCVRGGMGYWNRIRVDFPNVFEERAALEREIDRTCLNGIYLDELAPNRGNMNTEIFPSCGIGCMILK